MRLRIIGCLVGIGSAMPVWADCTGDIAGYWEKRPVGGQGAFEIIDRFRIDSATGILTQCERDGRWDSGFVETANEIIFDYARRTRRLRAAGANEYVTETWIADHQGVQSEYRVRATR